MTTLTPNLTTITVQDQNPGGKILHELFLKFSTQRISAAELIAERVRQEVAEYNQRSGAALLRHSLVLPTPEGDIVTNRHSGKKPPIIDADKQIAVALKAFESNGFFILADNRQLETLDDTVYLHEGLTVHFIKITPLVGG